MKYAYTVCENGNPIATELRTIEVAKFLGILPSAVLRYANDKILCKGIYTVTKELIKEEGPMFKNSDIIPLALLKEWDETRLEINPNAKCMR